MPNVQNVAFDPTMPPDLAAQQLQLQRQQELANYLRQQSLEPLQSQTVHTGAGAPDQVVKFSPIQGLVKALQAVQGRDMLNETDQQAAAMQAQRMAALVKLANGEDSGSSGGAGGTGGSGGTTKAGDNFTLSRLLRGDAIGKLGGNQAAGAYWDNAKSTNEQKNMGAMGLDMRDLAATEMAKRRKEGIIEYQPGTTAQDLSNGQTYFQPKVAEGIVLGQNGASQLPGYAAANAGIQGAQTQATEGVKAGLDMVTVNTPAGPIMVTRQQAVQMANPQGQQPQPQATGNDAAAIAAFNQQSPAGSNRPFAATAPVAGGPLTVQPQTTQTPQVGIPLQDEAQKKTAVDTAAAQVKRNFDQPQEKQALTSVSGSIDDALKQVQNLKTARGLGNITGTIMGRTPNISQPANDAQAQLDTLKAQIGVQVLTAMRQASKSGGAVGQVTEKEWPILQNQLGALQQAQSTDQFKRGLADVESSLNRIKTASQTAYDATYPAQQQQGQPARVRAYNPATERIE